MTDSEAVDVSVQGDHRGRVSSLSEGSGAATPREVRILLVDDHALVRRTMARMLRGLDCQVHECPSGPDALEALGHGTFDLMLLDRSMPGMGGVEVLQALRGQPELRGATYIAVVSAWAGEDRAQMYELGADAVLSKPLFEEDVEPILVQLRDRAESGDR